MTHPLHVTFGSHLRRARAPLVPAAALLALALAPLQPSLAAPTPKALAFLVVGDWGRNGDYRQRQVADQMAKAAGSHGARFVISTGDNFYNEGVGSVDAPAWKSSYENVYTQPELQVPWYAVLGNHDYRGNPQAQVDYTRKSKRWRMPARYFVTREKLPGGGTAEFFYLDTCPFVSHYRKDKEKYADLVEQDAGKQLRWLEEQLKRSKAEWRVVVGHHPVYSEGASHGDTPELIEKLKPLLDRYRVHLYLNGHDHDLQHIVVDGVNYVTSGAGSLTRPTKSGPDTRFSLGRTAGFVAVSMTRDSLTTRFVDWEGHERYTFSIGR